MKIGGKKAGLLCVFLHQVVPDRALEQAKFKNLGDYIRIPPTPSMSTPRDNSKKIILKQKRISLPLMPTVVSGLKMNRPCCFPLLQKNCHNPRKKRKRKEKQKNKQLSVFGASKKFFMETKKCAIASCRPGKAYINLLDWLCWSIKISLSMTMGVPCF